MNPHRWRPQPHHNIRHHTCPESRVKRASPEPLPASPLFTGVPGSLSASPVFTRVSGHPWLKRLFHAGWRPTVFPGFAPASVRGRFSGRRSLRAERPPSSRASTRGAFDAPPKSVRYPVSISAIAPRLKAQSASAPPSACDSCRPSAYNSRVRSTTRFLACFPACFLGCFPPC